MLPLPFSSTAIMKNGTWPRTFDAALATMGKNENLYRNLNGAVPTKVQDHMIH